MSERALKANEYPTLRIQRRVMTAANTTLVSLVGNALRDGTKDTPATFQQRDNLGVHLVRSKEFTKKAIANPILGKQVPDVLVSGVNKAVRALAKHTDSPNEYVYGSKAGEVTSNPIASGIFELGFTLDDKTGVSMAGDRQYAIGQILTKAEIPENHELRQWQYVEQSDLWIPVATIATTDSSPEDMLEDLCGEITNAVADQEVDLREVEARNAIVTFK
jgi:hypothetical protein